MMKNKHNPNGYKVCYREEGKKKYIRHFITYTHRQAVAARNGYMRFPPRAREDNRLLHNPQWVIIPIRDSEVRDGIWREAPF